MKLTADNLIAVSTNITNEELTLSILSGLGFEYDPVVVNTTARVDLPTLEKPYSLLLLHESRLDHLNGSTNLDLGNPAANYAGTFNKKHQEVITI